MSARPVHSSASNPRRTLDPAPAHSPAQAQPRLRSDAGNATGTSMLNQVDACEHDDNDAGLSDDDALLLQTLHEQLSALRLPLSTRLDDIVDLCSTLKNAAHRLRAVLVYHPQVAGLMRLKRSLSVFVKQLNAALNAQQGLNRLDPASLSQAQIQTLCQGLAVCVPSEAGMLFHPDYRQQDGLCLQGVTDTLLQRAMALGLPDALQANGEVLDILNWLSRGLKAGLLIPSAAIDLCFERSLVLILDWTGGDQCRQLLSDHNVGRCAVQCATVFNQTTLDLRAAAPEGLNDDTGETNGQRLQRCILNLCSNAVLNRLATAPVDTVSLLNICNTVKDAIDKRVLADTDPALLPALDRLVKVIAGLSERELLGVEEDCRPLANFSNFLRALAERRVRQELVFQTALPMLESAACKLIACINGEAFAYAWPSDQSLSNLVSFVKLCDKLLIRPSVAATTASAATSSSDSVTAMLTREALIEAGTMLTSALQTRAVSSFSKPNAVGGLLAGLAYLWQRNLAPRSPALQNFVAALLAQTGKTRGVWNDKSKAVVLPALQTLLEMEMVTPETAQPLLAQLIPQQRGAAGGRMMQDLALEIKRLGVVVEVVEPPPPMAMMPAPAKPAPVLAPTTAAERAIPGLTSIRSAPAPVYRQPTTASASSASTSTTALIEQPYQKAKKVAKPVRVAVASNSYNASANSASDNAAAADDAEPEAFKAGAAVAERRENKQNNHRTKKSNTGGRSSKSAPRGRDTALCKAILQGKPDQVQTLMDQAAAWPVNAITSVLDALMRELDVVGKNILAALGRFFAGVIKAEPMSGRAALTAYFIKHPPEYDGLHKLLLEFKLLPDLKNQDTPEKLLDLLASAHAEALPLWLTMPTVLARLPSRNSAGETLLHLAASNNHPQVVEGVLQLSLAATLVHQECLAGFTPLILAAFAGHESVVRALLSHATASAQARRINTRTLNALMAAADHGHVEVVRLLLADTTADEQTSAVNGGSVNTQFVPAVVSSADGGTLTPAPGTTRTICTVVHANGSNALILAAQEGHEEVVALLLAQPTAHAQATAVNIENCNALMAAAQKGRADTVRRLLQHPSAAQQVAERTIENRNALMLAAMHGHADVVGNLLDQPTAAAQICVVDKDGLNALMLAAENGHTEAVRLLLGKGTARELNSVVVKSGANALMLAAEKCHTDVVSLLLSHPLTVDQASVVDNDGRNALMRAAPRDGGAEVLKLLLALPSAEAQVNAVAIGWNALKLAIYTGYEDAVDVLLGTSWGRTQADRSTTTGNVLFKVAEEIGNPGIISLLRQAQPDS